MAPPTNFKIAAWVLSADCDSGNGPTCSNSMPLQDCLGCNKDGYLGTTNQDGYDFTRINTQWVSPTVDADGVTMRWTNATFRVDTVIDLRTMFDNVDGKLCLHPKVPAVIFVPPTMEDKFMANLRESMTPGHMKDPLVEWAVAYDPAEKGKENFSLFYVKASIEAEGHLFKTFNAEAKAAVMNILQEKGVKMEQVDFDVLQAKVSAQWGTWIGVNAALNLVSGKVSVFDAILGVGIATGAGIRDEAIEVKLLGCGITVGKRVGISVFGSSVEINFGRFLPV
ncbi:hypothetical protein FB451DRAFT_1300565 [Mycena latifolia]|nr:hypothetical protein FB451DRAFT_1300565 [Mycena latifolia]